MKFRITRHAGSAAPPDALDQLSQLLRPSGDVVSFSNAGQEITATWRESGSSRTEEELTAIGRLEVLDVVLATCERAPELRADWFAVSAVP